MESSVLHENAGLGFCAPSWRTIQRQICISKLVSIWSPWAPHHMLRLLLKGASNVAYVSAVAESALALSFSYFSFFSGQVILQGIFLFPNPIYK